MDESRGDEPAESGATAEKHTQFKTMNNDTNTSESESELFANQQHSGLYVGADTDGERLYADSFTTEVAEYLDTMAEGVVLMGQKAPGGIGKTARMFEWVRRTGIGNEFSDPKGGGDR
jgi:hypothetical protein